MAKLRRKYVKFGDFVTKYWTMAALVYHAVCVYKWYSKDASTYGDGLKTVGEL